MALLFLAAAALFGVPPQQAVAPASPPVPTITSIKRAGPPEDPVGSAIARYRQITDLNGKVRPCGAHGGDIVVCGRDQSQRLPPEDHSSANDVVHEGSGRGALAAQQRPCPPTGCTGVNLLLVPIKLFQIGRALITNSR